MFNAEQCDGLPARYCAKAEPSTLSPLDRIERADCFFAGTRACYAEGPDYVQMPPSVRPAGALVRQGLAAERTPTCRPEGGRAVRAAAPC